MRTPSSHPRQRITRAIVARFFVRCHMLLIFAGVVAAGVVSSRLWLGAGIHWLPVRYALAALCAYLAFFVLVRLWIAYVIGARGTGASDVDQFDVVTLDVPTGNALGDGDSPAPAHFHPAGGHFGGGGASGSFGHSESGGSSGGGTAGGSVVADIPDELALIVLACLCVLAVLGGSAIYLTYQAPVILPEAAFDLLLASGLTVAGKKAERRGWIRGVVRATVVPFALSASAAIFLGWAVARVCPHALTLRQAFRACF